MSDVFEDLRGDDPDYMLIKSYKQTYNIDRDCNDADVVVLMRRAKQNHSAIIARLEAENARLQTQEGWLLENPDTSSAVSYLTLSPDVAGFWTTDSIKALRFARKQDAEAFENYFGPIEGAGARAVAHQWR